MKIRRSVLVAVGFLSSAASADVILCEDTSRNHMGIGDSQVSACLAAGVGNLSGNVNGSNPDPFLAGVGFDYFAVTKSDESTLFGLSFTQDDKIGTWGFDASFWDVYSDAAIGFKFGTGNKPDEWFVFGLIDGVTSGDWEFFNVFKRGGGLSHINLYASGESVNVPEPGALGMFGLGLVFLSLAAARRRKAARNAA